MLRYVDNYVLLYDWRQDAAEIAEEELDSKESNARYWESECEEVAKKLYPEFRAVCLRDLGRLPCDELDRDDWQDWLFYGFSDESREQEALSWHIKEGAWFTYPSQMEEFFIRNQ